MDRWLLKFRQVTIKEQDALLILIVLGLFVVVVVFALFKGAERQAKSRIEALNSQYRKAYSLYEKIKSSSSNERYFDGNILLLVQKLQKNKDVGSKIVSVSTTEDGNAIELKIRHLNLKELMWILKSLEGFSNVKLRQYVLRKSFSSDKLLDLDAVVVKTQ